MELTLAALIRRCKQATGGHFSDLQAREGDCLRIRTTRGIEPLDEPVLTRNDLIDFLSVIAPQLKVERALDTNHGELDFGFEFDGDAYRANLTYYDGRKWIKVVMRKLDKEIRTLAQLGLRDSLLKWLERGSGLVFVVGPTGSGKSSTLASMIEHLNQRAKINDSSHILLRASSPESLGADSLMRAASPSAATDPEQLLRAQPGGD